MKADAVQPEWCRLNEGQCYWKDDSDNPMFWQLETPLTTPLNLQGYVSPWTEHLLHFEWVYIYMF